MKKGLASLVVSLAAASIFSNCKGKVKSNVHTPPSICAPEMQRYEVVSSEDIKLRGNYIEIEVVPRYQEVVPVGQERKMLGFNFHAVYDSGRLDSIGYRTFDDLLHDLDNLVGKADEKRFNGAILNVYYGGFDEERRCRFANELGIPYIAWGQLQSLKML
ncbi:hypothetical protein HYU22_00030 [Candidatus Woesearchaeota archaeon]|nr:hypothetical protein [Candidatus Woesearchaeota archaeon]